MSTATATEPLVISKTFGGIIEDSLPGTDECISIISTDSVDRDFEVVIPKGVSLDSYRKNPIVMYGHSKGLPIEGEEGLPVGKNIWIKSTSDGHGLIARTKFDTDDNFSSKVCGKVKRGILNSWSITFLPKSYGPPTADEIRKRPDWAEAKRVFREVELVEYSVVSAPANIDAITIAKGMVPYHAYPESDAAWDASKARVQFKEYAGDGDNFDAAKYGSGFAYVEDGKGDELTAYKYPHHYIEGGKIVTSRQGVIAAIAACRGARSGKNPEGADDALRHLLKHAKEMELPSAEEVKSLLEEETTVTTAIADETETRVKGDKEPDPDDVDEAEEGELEEEGREGVESDYMKMCKSLKTTAKGIKHSGKAGNLFAHKEDMKAHWHGHDDDWSDNGEEAGYHSRSEIRDMLSKAEECKGCMVSGKPPKGDKWEQIHGETSKSVQSETMGSLGGFAVGIGGKDAADGDPDEDEDGDMEESDGLRRYHYVKMFGGSYHKNIGRIHSIHSKGLVPHVDNDIIASKDAPVARVQLYKVYQDGHMPTQMHVGHPVAKMEKIDDLKPPSKRKAEKAVREPEKPVKEEPKPKAIELPKSPLRNEDIVTAHAWSLFRSGKMESVIARITDDALAHVLGKG